MVDIRKLDPEVLKQLLSLDKTGEIAKSLLLNFERDFDAYIEKASIEELFKILSNRRIFPEVFIYKVKKKINSKIKAFIKTASIDELQQLMQIKDLLDDELRIILKDRFSVLMIIILTELAKKSNFSDLVNTYLLLKKYSEKFKELEIEELLNKIILETLIAKIRDKNSLDLNDIDSVAELISHVVNYLKNDKEIDKNLIIILKHLAELILKTYNDLIDKYTICKFFKEIFRNIDNDYYNTLDSLEKELLLKLYDKYKDYKDFFTSSNYNKRKDSNKSKNSGSKIEGYYATLGLSRGVSKEEVKSAYRKLAFQNHPDRGGNVEKMVEINVAYDELMKILS